MEQLRLECQVYAGIWGGRMRYKGAVHDGQSILWEGKWRHEQLDAVAEAERNAARITRERAKRVIH